MNVTDDGDEARLLPLVARADSTETSFRNLTLDREIVDASGRTWRRRGDSTDDRRLRRLLADPAVRVVHDYLGTVREIAPSERAAFWARAAGAMRGSEHASFEGAEFTNDARGHLLVIHENC